jgi:undecaprenyl phosphate-alpha-L-ara4N flippase subunit ArnE
MTALTLFLCLFCQVLTVAGNLLLKHAMAGIDGQQRSRLQTGLWLFAGIALLTLWFFLWLGLLSKYQLSQLYAFEGLAPVLLMASAWLFLGEKLPLVGWIGVGLIGGGLMLVAGA